MVLTATLYLSSTDTWRDLNLNLNWDGGIVQRGCVEEADGKECRGNSDEEGPSN